MKITKTEQGWRVDVPEDVVAQLGLRDGQMVHVSPAATPPEANTPAEIASALANVRGIRKAVPANYRFDRSEANARR